MSKKAYSITYKVKYISLFLLLSSYSLRIFRTALHVALQVEMPELKVFKATSSELICSIDLSKVYELESMYAV